MANDRLTSALEKHTLHIKMAHIVGEIAIHKNGTRGGAHTSEAAPILIDGCSEYCVKDDSVATPRNEWEIVPQVSAKRSRVRIIDNMARICYLCLDP